MIHESATSYFEFEIAGPVANSTIRYKVALINGLPVIISQDSKHGCKTMRNQMLTGARLLVIGLFCLCYFMLLALAHVVSSPLYLRDVERVDKQDDRAAARLFSAEALDCLLKNFPEHRTMAVYLFVLGELGDAWQNRRIPHAERVRMALRARYFLMVWHAHVTAHPDHRHDIHFISRESYDILLRLCDGLVELIVVYREFYPSYPLLPWLHSTEMLEHFFGVLRSLKKDFNFADALWLEPKLRTLMMGAFKNFTAEEQANATAAGYWNTYHSAPDYDADALRNYPPDSEMGKMSQRAIRDVTMLCDAVGIEALEMLEAYKPPTYDDGATTTDRTDERRATLHDLMNGFPLIAPASVVLEDAQEMAQYALVAQSTDATMDMYVNQIISQECSNIFYGSLNLPDSNPNELSELRASIAEALEGIDLVCRALEGWSCACINPSSQIYRPVRKTLRTTSVSLPPT